MRSWLRVLSITVPIVVLCLSIGIYSVYWITNPGNYQQRFDRIKIGMSEEEVDAIMGSEGDFTAKTKKYAITGDNRQRVWVVGEKGEQLEIVIVFDANSRVITKEIYKSSAVLNRVFKDL